MHIYLYINICRYLHVYIYTCIFICIYTHIWTLTYVYMHNLNTYTYEYQQGIRQGIICFCIISICLCWYVCIYAQLMHVYQTNMDRETDRALCLCIIGICLCWYICIYAQLIHVYQTHMDIFGNYMFLYHKFMSMLICMYICATYTCIPNKCGYIFTNMDRDPDRALHVSAS